MASPLRSPDQTSPSRRGGPVLALPPPSASQVATRARRDSARQLRRLLLPFALAVVVAGGVAARNSVPFANVITNRVAADAGARPQAAPFSLSGAWRDIGQRSLPSAAAPSLDPAKDEAPIEADAATGERSSGAESQISVSSASLPEGAQVPVIEDAAPQPSGESRASAAAAPLQPTSETISTAHAEAPQSPDATAPSARSEAHDGQAPVSALTVPKASQAPAGGASAQPQRKPSHPRAVADDNEDERPAARTRGAPHRPSHRAEPTREPDTHEVRETRREPLVTRVILQIERSGP